MNVLVSGKYFNCQFRKTEKGGYHELRILQKNDKGVNTEVFPVFEENLVNVLTGLNENDDITLDCDVYVKNGYQQKKINYVLDVTTGEKLS